MELIHRPKSMRSFLKVAVIITVISSALVLTLSSFKHPISDILHAGGEQQIPSRNVGDYHVDNADVFYRGQLPVSVRSHQPDMDCERGRFLVYKCVSMCGGMGDREKGIISAFLLALLTNRTFAIDMPNPCRFDKFVHSNLYDWQTCGHVVRTENASLLNHIDGNGQRFASTIPEADFDKIWKDQLVVMQINVILVDKIRKHRLSKSRIPWLHSFTDEEIFGYVLGMLFRLDEALVGRFDDFRRDFVKDRTLVCAHVRIGKNPSIPRDDHLPYGVPNEEKVIKFLQSFNDTKRYAIYLATDSDIVRKKSRDRIPNLQTGTQTIVHVDRLNVNQSMACDGFALAVYEQFLLSRCDVLILTRSGFGTAAAYMRGHSNSLYYYSTKTKTILKSANLSEIQRDYKFT